MPRTTKTTLPKLTKRLDAIFSRYVRLSARDRFGLVQCYTCSYRGPVEKLQAGHWIPRQHKATRWELWNVKPQCFACNMYYGGRPQQYRHQLVLELGEMEVQRLALRRHEVRQWSREELVELIADYKAKVKALES